ncbi:IS30 family transposase [Rhizobium leguminosarum]|uniref:IS30 family transposase n=1 Tax=Rhizobium leguminosarum TaxID=384 RepID=UPI0004B8F2EB|nr:IS30 family transposase [Rhizobium leguminosarum]
MTVHKRASDRCTREKDRSPGRPPAWQREERVLFWQAIALGRSSEEAALDVGVSAPLGPRWFRSAGGMPPTHLAPWAKPRTERYLTFREREDIALELAKGTGIRSIARKLGRTPSTISREIRRNAATRSGSLDYRASAAQWHADRAARRPRPSKLASNPALRQYVEERLAGKVTDLRGVAFEGPAVVWKKRRAVHRQSRRWSTAWSPEQIARRLEIDHPEDQTMRISHEAIYQSLYIQGRGALRRELTVCLRTGRALRVPRERSRSRNKSFIGDAIMISDRPADIADRAIPGHWEGDLILGLGSSAIGTLVERTSRFTMLLHLPRMEGHQQSPRVKNGPALAGHGAEAVRKAIIRSMAKLPEQLRQSLTWDQGAEMAQHADLRIDTGLMIYFCDPQSPWQRGSNENTNGLLRQYFPKGTDLSQHSDNELHAVAHAINTRPRKTLDWKTPAEVLDQFLARR